MSDNRRKLQHVKFMHVAFLMHLPRRFFLPEVTDVLGEHKRASASIAQMKANGHVKRTGKRHPSNRAFEYEITEKGIDVANAAFELLQDMA